MYINHIKLSKVTLFLINFLFLLNFYWNFIQKIMETNVFFFSKRSFFNVFTFFLFFKDIYKLCNIKYRIKFLIWNLVLLLFYCRKYQEIIFKIWK